MMLLVLQGESVIGPNPSVYADFVGKEFLAQNAQKEGVIITSSGLQYIIGVNGTGTIYPTLESTVLVNYNGTLFNGLLFDSTYGDDGEPAEFPLNALIKGFAEGCTYMTVGAVYTFYLPSELGYGAAGAGEGLIPGNSMLIFGIELLAIKS